MATKFPKTLGECIDQAYTLRAERLEVQREMEAKLETLKAGEKDLNDHIINTFSKNEIEGAKGSIASASISQDPIPTVEDWPKFYAYILKTKSFDLLERRPAKLACKARWDEKVTIPGVKKFIVPKLSLTKIAGK